MRQGVLVIPKFEPGWCPRHSITSRLNTSSQTELSKIKQMHACMHTYIHFPALNMHRRRGNPYKPRSERHVYVATYGRRTHNLWVFDNTASNWVASELHQRTGKNPSRFFILDMHRHSEPHIKLPIYILIPTYLLLPTSLPTYSHRIPQRFMCMFKV